MKPKFFHGGDRVGLLLLLIIMDPRNEKTYILRSVWLSGARRSRKITGPAQVNASVSFAFLTN